MSDDDQAAQGGEVDGDQNDAATDAGDQNTDSNSGGQDGTDDRDDGDKPLGPAGQKALEAEKAKRKAESAKRRKAEAELAALKKQGGDETDQARQEVEQAALSKANNRILRAEVRAAAAGKLADPADALKLLDLAQFEVDADGEVDTDEINAAIDDLLKAKPYLAPVTSPAKRFQGAADGGARGRAVSIDQQIATAEKEGRWPEARRLKIQKAYQDKK